jgi:hypothetical protein
MVRGYQRRKKGKYGPSWALVSLAFTAFIAYVVVVSGKMSEKTRGTERERETHQFSCKTDHVHPTEFPGLVR